MYITARLARLLVGSQSIGTLASIYPANTSVPGVAGHPFALMEYYAPCYSNGSLAFVMMGISQNARNILASNESAASFMIQAPLSRSPVTKPRLSLIGNVTVIEQSSFDAVLELEECYLDRHPDSKFWLPGKAGFHVRFLPFNCAFFISLYNCD